MTHDQSAAPASLSSDRLAFCACLSWTQTLAADIYGRKDESAALDLWRLLLNVIMPLARDAGDSPAILRAYDAIARTMRDFCNGGHCDANFPDDHRQQLIVDRLEEIAGILRERLPARRSHHGRHQVKTPKRRRYQTPIDRAA
jgi:hypothetical protein